jgi:predicted Zn-dependent peptidase
MKMPQAESKTVLDNGVRILTKQMPHVHSVSMGVWVNAGARDEAPLESGLCHLIEHMLFKGTLKRTAFQIAKEFDAIGGQSNAFTSMENTCCHARVMDTHLATMVDILSDIFLNSCFHENEYEKERPVILQEIGMLEDNPDDFIHVLLGQAFWGGQSLGQSVLGTRENLLRFDVSAVRNFFHKFNQPDRIIIAASGNLTHDRFVELIAPAFETISQGGALPERISSFGQSNAIVCAKDIEQAHISIGVRGLSMTDPDRYTLNLLNTILGGNMSSRLFQEIRERRGLAYSVYSFILSHADAGMFGAYAAVEPGRVPETIGLIVNEMRRLKEESVDQSAVQDAKEFVKGNLMLASESVDNQMARLAQNEFNLGRVVPLEEIMEEIDKVGADDIQRLSETLFQPTPSALAVLGPVTDEAAVRDAFTL